MSVELNDRRVQPLWRMGLFVREEDGTGQAWRGMVVPSQILDSGGAMAGTLTLRSLPPGPHWCLLLRTPRGHGMVQEDHRTRYRAPN